MTKHCDEVLQNIAGRVQAGWFLEPVDLDEIPHYTNFVAEPMDLGTVGDKLKGGEAYRRADDFARDVRLTFKNAVTFTPDPNANVHKAAVAMDKAFMKKYGGLMIKLGVRSAIANHDLLSWDSSWSSTSSSSFFASSSSSSAVALPALPQVVAVVASSSSSSGDLVKDPLTKIENGGSEDDVVMALAAAAEEPAPTAQEEPPATAADVAPAAAPKESDAMESDEKPAGDDDAVDEDEDVAAAVNDDAEMDDENDAMDEEDEDGAGAENDEPEEDEEGKSDDDDEEDKSDDEEAAAEEEEEDMEEEEEEEEQRWERGERNGALRQDARAGSQGLPVGRQRQQEAPGAVAGDSPHDNQRERLRAVPDAAERRGTASAARGGASDPRR